jgi:hypothetical protein
MTNDPKRPFYRLGSVRFLGPVPRKDFRQFLDKQFTLSGYPLDELTIEKIIDVCKDVPYNIQMLAHNCWAVKKESSLKRPMDVAFIEELLKKVVLRQDPFYTLLWNRLTAVQQKTLYAVIRLDGKNLQSAKACEIVGKQPATIRRSVQLMIESGLLREDEKLNSVQVVFEDPFFEKWIELSIHF